ncbi:MAG: cation transporter, partial [Deltaproteobacteria bacterium]|nr:cation transporter [Deltaproteobacteria bacterium]
MATGSKKAVIAALFGNFCVAVFKLIAGTVANSSSMLAESLHSFSDTFNQIFLLIGLKRSKKE